jgi:hypothetical protein
VYAVAQPEAPGYDLHQGLIDVDLIEHETPDWAECIFSISGSRTTVVLFEIILWQLGVRRSRIRLDYFPCFA